MGSLATFKVGRGKPCLTCTHPRAAIINCALINETASLPKLSDRYGMSVTALYKHRVNHLGRRYSKSGIGRPPKRKENEHEN